MARKGYIAWSPIRDLMKDSGAGIVARDAVDLLIDEMERFGKKITEAAIEVAKIAKRKKVQKKDLELALKWNK